MPSVIPPPVAGDHEDVHWALSTANSLHQQGDFEAALRWLRKAVTAAMACRHDRRANELGRWVMQLEDSMGLAHTQRGAVARDVTLGPPPAEAFDPERTETEHSLRHELDQPTYVDGPRHTTLAVEDTHNDDYATDSEITLVPYTMKAAGGQAVRRVSEPKVADRPRTFQPPDRRVSRTLQVEQFPRMPPPLQEDADESTAAMAAVPNAHEISDRDAVVLPPPTAPAAAAIPRHRVALVASADGPEPRVLILPRGATAPSGAGVAILIPVSSPDAQRIAQLLGLDELQ